MSTCRIKNNSDIDNVDMKSVFGTVPPSPSIIHATHTIHDNHVESTVNDRTITHFDTNDVHTLQAHIRKIYLN